MAEKLKIIITGDSADATKALKAVSTELRDGINKYAKYGAASVAAGAAIIAGVVNSSRKSIDALAKKSDQIGIATEKLAAFQHLGELTGVSSEKMNSSLERMSKRLGEAASGMGAAKPQLEALNLSASQLIKLSPDQQYQKLAEAIKGLDTQSEKAAATAALFGREGLALLNTIEAGAEGFANAERDVAAFGTAISRTDAAKVEEANDAFERVQEALKGVATQLTVKLAPYLKVIADQFTDAARSSGGFSDSVSSGINMAIKAVSFLGDMIRGLSVVWKIVEIAALGFVSLTITALDELQKAGAAALNWIPGLDIQPSPALSEWAEDSRQALIGANAELDELVSKPMPSANIKQFFAEVEKTATQTAAAIAESKITPAMEGETAGAGGLSEEARKTIADQQEKYTKLREMAEQFQLSEEEREVARFERENEQFNLDLERMIEQGIVVDEAVALQNQVREDAEAIHQEKLRQIQENAKTAEHRLWESGWQGKTQLAGEAMGNIATVLMSGGKKNFELGKQLAIAEALVNIPATAIAAYKSLAPIPFVGPALGAAAAAAAIASGMGRVSQIKAQKYGGQAHDGLESVPNTGTFLLEAGERVVKKADNQKLTRALDEGGIGGGVQIGSVNITVTKDMRDMSAEEMDEVVEQGLAPAIRRGVDKLLDFGLMPREEFA